MVFGRLLWKGVKYVGKKVVAHARASVAREQRLEALNVQVKGRPQETYPSFGQAYERMMYEERIMQETLRIRAKILGLERYEEACREQGRMYDAMC